MQTPSALTIGQPIFQYTDGYTIYREYDYAGGSAFTDARYTLVDSKGNINSWANKGNFKVSMQQWDQLHGKKKRLNKNYGTAK